jgi:hypothetical protein
VSASQYAGASVDIGRSDLRTVDIQPWKLSPVCLIQLLTPCAGQWFKQNPGKRENIFLATKFANAMKEDGTRYVDSCKDIRLPLLCCVYTDKFVQLPSTAAKHANARCSASA